MTPPRLVTPGQLLFITRRAHQRRFSMAPTKAVRQLVLYLLAVGSQRYAMRLHGAVAQSTHYHLALTDDRGQYPLFMQWFNSTLARALNCRQGKRDSVFSPTNKPHVAVLTDRGAVEAKLAYIAANPVLDGCVAHGRDWRGARTNPDYFLRERVIKRPKFFFDPDGGMPEEVVLRLHVPGTHKDRTTSEFAELLAQQIAAAEAAARQAHRSAGKTFLGMDACRNVDPDRLASRHELLGQRRAAEVIGRDDVSRAQAVETLCGFRSAYAMARARWKDGDHAVVWPFGTWQVRILQGAIVATGPPH